VFSNFFNFHLKTDRFRSSHVGLNCNVAYNFYATMGSKRLAVAERPVA